MCVVARFGDAHQQLVAETLVGYPCCFVTAFGKGFDDGFFLNVQIRILWCGARQHKRHRHSCQVSYGIYTIECDEIWTLAEAWCGVAWVAVDAEIAVTRRFADDEYDDCFPKSYGGSRR